MALFSNFNNHEISVTEVDYTGKDETQLSYTAPSLNRRTMQTDSSMDANSEVWTDADGRGQIFRYLADADKYELSHWRPILRHSLL